MNMNIKAVVGLLLLLGVVVLGGKWTSVPIESPLLAQSETASLTKRVIGPVATVGESESEIQFLARVDTGAKTCSLHALEKTVLGGSKYMEENVGKRVCFRVENRNGETEWLERSIAEVRKIRTSEGEETRYLVPLVLTCDGVEREVLVTLNDRSRMRYTMLLGRNYLSGHFLVDVTREEQAPELLAAGL